MQFQHDIRIEASPEVVWTFLWDVEQLARCIPGCQEASVVEPHVRYTALVADRVGPLKLKMPLDLVVQSADEGRALRVTGTGKDSALGSSVRVDIAASLEPDGAATRLLLSVEASVSGKIAGLGMGLFKRKFDDIMTQFGQRVKAAIEGAPAAAPSV
ncbi:MAG TPA: SRPBCC domain-containing protein [Chloroflexota bacterium]|nr:SRPBCC domain-containing protein [Chloroflexota bacterium]